MQRAAFFPRRRRAWVTPTVTVDLPSPAGVGLIPVTSTSRPLGARRANAARRTLALYFPYSSISSASSPSSAAMSATGRSLAAWAMAMSLGTSTAVTGPLAPESKGPVHARAEGASGGAAGELGDLVHPGPARPPEAGGDLAHEPRLLAPAPPPPRGA